MTYKTIVVHVDGSPQSADRVRIAAQLASGLDAHLVGLAATGLPAPSLMPGASGEGILDLATILSLHRESAISCLDAFRSSAELQGAKLIETLLADDELGLALCLNARYADLLVMSQTCPETLESFQRADAPQYVLLHGARPLLLLPCLGNIGEIGKRILVAWDASESAVRAVNNALPLLRRAEFVEIIVFMQASLDTQPDSHPGLALARYLARQAVNAVVSEIEAPLHIDIGEALLTQAARSRADLLVMGGYGHAKFRELIMGGVTRSVLETMKIPVLMSH